MLRFCKITLLVIPKHACLGRGKLPLSRTGPKSEQPTFKCNICFNSTHRTSRAQSNYSQEPCEWFGHDLQVLLVKLEPILHLKVDCLDFGPVWDGRFTLLLPNFRRSIFDLRILLIVKFRP